MGPPASRSQCRGYSVRSGKMNEQTRQTRFLAGGARGLTLESIFQRWFFGGGPNRLSKMLSRRRNEQKEENTRHVFKQIIDYHSSATNQTSLTHRRFTMFPSLAGANDFARRKKFFARGHCCELPAPQQARLESRNKPSSLFPREMTRRAFLKI